MTVTLGIDLGTSSCKAMLYGVGNGPLAMAAASYPTHRPREGYAEQDPEAWLAAMVRTCHELAGHPSWSKVSCVGLSGQMHTLVLTDGRGRPIRPAIVWQDVRSRALLETLDPEDRAQIEQITGNPAHTIMSFSTMLWLKNHEAASLQRASHVLMPKDYARCWLTGEVGTDPSDASGTGMWDMLAGEWTERLLSRFGIPLHLLPDILTSFALHGTIADGPASQLGLRAGIPVAVGAADLAAEALGAALQPGELIVRLGTAGALIMSTAEPKTGRFNCYVGAGVGVQEAHWLLVAGTQTCGAAIDWVRKNLLGECRHVALYAAAQRAEPGARGLLFVPHLQGERAPYFEDSLRGCVSGLTLAHTRNDLARAALEGVAFSLLDAAQVLPSDGSNRVIKLIGLRGGHRFWAQLLADVFARRVHWLPRVGPALGAAMLAAWALGVCPGGQQRGTAFEPRPEQMRTYARAFRRYRETIHAFAI